MAYVINNGVNIYYDTFGNKDLKEVIVFLHGAGSDRTIWKEQVKKLKEDYYIIAIDNRGSGKSDCPEYNYNVSMLSTDIIAVLDKEKLNEVNLIGFSLGGLVAQKIANDHPKRVKKLILLNCSLGSGNPDTVLPEQNVINMFLFCSALSMEDRVKNAMDFNYGKEFEKNNPELYKKYYNEIIRNADGIQYQIPVIVSGKILIKNYEKIKFPVLSILSTDDPVIPKENGNTIQKHLPHSKVKYLKGYHSSPQIHPEKVTRLIKNFINTQEN